VSQNISTDPAIPSKHQRPPFWRDERVLQVLTQVVFLALLAAVAAWLFYNYSVQLETKNLIFSFDFLHQEASLKGRYSPRPTITFGRSLLVWSTRSA
jgi:ABC-type amino acid transport system permease subunit